MPRSSSVSSCLSFFCNLRIKLWLPKTPASFPTKRDIRHSILNIGNYVFCRFCSFFFIGQFYANCYHCCVNECAIQLNHVTYRIVLNWSPTFFFFKPQDRIMEAQNSSHQPFEACVIAGFSSNVQHQIRKIGNYVFRPLSFILAFFALIRLLS